MCEKGYRIPFAMGPKSYALCILDDKSGPRGQQRPPHRCIIKVIFIIQQDQQNGNDTECDSTFLKTVGFLLHT